MTHRRLPVIVALSLAAVASGPARAGDPAPARDPGELSLVTERVVVFKDGHGLFVRRGTATADASGRVTTGEVPSGAVLGCFWATSPSGKVLAMTSSWRERTSIRTRVEPCRDVTDLLRANVGRDVALGVTREGKSDIRGRIVEVLGASPPTTSGSIATVPGGGVVTRGATERIRPLDPVGPAAHVVLEVAGERLALPTIEVRTVIAPSLATTVERRDEIVTREKRLSIAFGAEAAGKPVEVRLFYFAEGIRWIPTYRVGGDLVTEASIDLQGEVVNEAEPLAGTELDLVIGVPSFRFADTPSPLSLETALRQALAEAAPQLMSQRLSNNFMSNATGGRSDAGAAGALAAAPELAAESAQDLFVHRLGKVDLGVGERASYPISDGRAALRHVYTADVHVARDARSGRSGMRPVGEADGSGGSSGTMVPVRHQIELANAGPSPWTTGAALVLQREIPIAQNLLRFTSVGAKTLLPLTIAVDLPARYEEVETGRTLNALVKDGRTYGLVRKKATIVLRSRRTEASRMLLSLRLGGKADAATNDGRITLDDQHAEDWEGHAPLLNNRSEVRWELDLAAGATVTLETTFSFYVG